MGKINWARVLLGGLAAGVVVNIFEAAVVTMLSEEYKVAMAALGKTMDESPAMLALLLAYGFGYGIAAVWFYAAIRPRFGPGPKTAVCAALAVWFVGYLLPTTGYVAFDLFPMRLLAIGLANGFVETILGTLLGAWLYKEA